jgi:hypothetical protein
MITAVDSKISLEVSGGDQLAMTSLKNHPHLVASRPLTSHITVDVQMRLLKLAKFSLLPLHSSTTSHIILYSSFSLPLSISQQLIYIRASAINLNQCTLVQHIKKRLDFLNLHIIRDICTSTTNFFNFKVFCSLHKRGDENELVCARDHHYHIHIYVQHQS